MEGATDQYIEFKQVNGTPEEIMSQYAAIVNAAFKENRMGLSKRWGELMEFEVRAFWLEEIVGSTFVCLAWHSEKYLSKKAFFEQSDDEDIIEHD